jgi:hypothetical protein
LKGILCFLKINKFKQRFCFCQISSKNKRLPNLVCVDMLRGEENEEAKDELALTYNTKSVVCMMNTAHLFSNKEIKK